MTIGCGYNNGLPFSCGDKKPMGGKWLCKKCEVIYSGKKCGKKAKFIVRHKDHSEEKSFYVCLDCIPAYKFKIDPRAEGSFILKESKNGRK